MRSADRGMKKTGMLNKNSNIQLQFYAFIREGLCTAVLDLQCEKKKHVIVFHGKECRSDLTIMRL